MGLYIDLFHPLTLIMDVVISSKGQDPSDFVAKFNQPLNLEKNYEVAVKAIYYGSAYNIPPHKYWFKVVNGDGAEKMYQIEPGYYSNMCEIMFAMYKEMKEAEDVFIRGHGEPFPAPTIDVSYKYRKVTITFENDQRFQLLDEHKNQDLFNLFGYAGADVNDTFKTFSAAFEDKVPNPIVTGFIFSNIVPNMSVNGEQARMLTTFPIQSNFNNFYEFSNPTYRPVAVQTRTLLEMNLKITDTHGREVVLDTSGGGYPTTIVLNFREAINSQNHN